MANANLISCPDCKNEVSRLAASCPKCGRPIRTRQSAMGLLAAVGIGLLLFWVGVSFVLPRFGIVITQ